MKFNDSRIHPGVIHDIGLLDIEIKNLQLIQSNEKLRFKTDQERKKALSILVMTAFNSIHLPYPSNDVIAPSYHTHYRPLVTEILKHLLKYIETYCNEFKSTMLESYSFNFSPGCRLGLKLIYHPLLEKDAIKIRREHVRITAEILNEICNGFYTITSVLDKMYIKACYIKEIKEIIIWATIGPTIVLDRIPFPCENELFKEIAK